MKRWFYKTAAWIVKWPFYLLFRIHLEGMENIPSSGGFILCSNHTSDLDPVFLVLYTPRVIRFMAKKEIFQVFALRRVVRWLGAFPVDRGAGDYGVLDQAADYVKAGDVLGIFPEGTRSKDGHLLRIKSGIGVVAAKTKADILPVCIKGKNGGRPRIFRSTTIRFGPVIPYGELGISGESAHAVRGAIRKITQVMKDLCGEGETV